MLKSLHLENVRNARRQVMYWKTYAEEYPDQVLFWSVDRMDQLKTVIPKEYRFVFTAKINYSYP